MRDVVLIRDFHLLNGVIAFLVAVVLVNVTFGVMKIGWQAMPISHMNHVWNVLGMVLAGLCFALASIL